MTNSKLMNLWNLLYAQAERLDNSELTEAQGLMIASNIMSISKVVETAIKLLDAETNLAIMRSQMEPGESLPPMIAEVTGMSPVPGKIARKGDGS